MDKSNPISDERLHLHSLYYPSKDLDGLFEVASKYLKELEDYKKQEEDGLLLKLPWHKVKDGDLPKRQGQRVWLCTISKDYFMANYWDDTMVCGKQFFEVPSVGGRIALSNVLAWMELPKYEGK